MIYKDIQICITDMDNTQLTLASDYNTDRMVFSKPVVSSIAGSGQMTYKRIMISTQNKDGTQGDLVIGTERLFSFGVGTRNPDGDPKDGYQVTLSLHNRDNPSSKELEWISVFNKIIDKCKDHLIAVKDQLCLYEMTKDDSLLKSCNPLKYKKEKGKVVDGVPPILGVKLITRKGEIASLFHDENGNRVDPMSLIKKHCYITAAIKVESIFIGSKLIAIQIKLHEAQVKLVDTGLRSLLAPVARPADSGVKILASNESPFDTDDDDIEL